MLHFFHKELSAFAFISLNYPIDLLEFIIYYMPHICIYRDLEILMYSECVVWDLYLLEIFSHALFCFYILLRCSLLLLLLFGLVVVVLGLELRALRIYVNVLLLSHIPSSYWSIFNE